MCYRPKIDAERLTPGAEEADVAAERRNGSGATCNERHRSIIRKLQQELIISVVKG